MKKDSHQDGHTYWPNTYQKHNDFVDVIMRLLPATANCVLDVACREIGGWDESRQTYRARISLSRFEEKTGLSRNTVINGLDILGRANIVLPVGAPTQDGQEYELNRGQKGPYDFDYLANLKGRAGNPDPSAARSARAARRGQAELPISEAPDMGVLVVQNLHYQDLNQSNQLTTGGYLNRPQVVISIDRSNQQTKEISFDTSLDTPIPGVPLTPFQLWQAVLSDLQLVLTKPTFDTWMRNTQAQGFTENCLTVVAADEAALNYLNNSMLSTIRRTLRRIAERDIEVEFVVVQK